MGLDSDGKELQQRADNKCLSLDSQASKGTNGPKVPLWNGEENGALTEECRGEEQLG